ncbi:ribosomal protein S6 [Xylaria arbuscula]|nr:ribosomal protein S6 [Xylaria arbuscula]
MISGANGRTDEPTNNACDYGHDSGSGDCDDTIKMLYELIGIVRPTSLAEVREIVLAAGQLVLQQKGVIRGLQNWGEFSLPKAISVHQMRHTTGYYFAMRFDASVATQEEVRKMLRLDPRMIRHSSIKLGDGKLGTMSRLGKVEWRPSGVE